MKKNNLTKEFFNNRSLILLSIDESNKKIEDRVDYIVAKITGSFKLSYNEWNFPDSNGLGEYGTYESALAYEDSVNIIIDVDENNPLLDIFIMDSSNKEIMLYSSENYEWYFPINWMISDFEEELKLGIKKYKDHLSKELKKEKDEEKLLVEKIKKGLSDDEFNTFKERFGVKQ